jgi:hypothetical protein
VAGQGRPRQRQRFRQHRLSSQEPAATRELFAALPSDFGFASLMPPPLVSAEEIEAGREQVRELGVAVAAPR